MNHTIATICSCNLKHNFAVLEALCFKLQLYALNYKGIHLSHDRVASIQGGPECFTQTLEAINFLDNLDNLVSQYQADERPHGRSVRLGMRERPHGRSVRLGMREVELWQKFYQQQYSDWIDGDRKPDPLPEKYEDFDHRRQLPNANFSEI